MQHLDITDGDGLPQTRRLAHAELEQLVDARTADLLRANEELRSEIRERQRIEEELRQSQEQLVQSQKLQAVGQLANGIAHEFNNILTVIFGYLSVVELDFETGHPGRADVRRIAEAADRAALLTRQLLAFSRHQRLTPQLVDLNALLEREEHMLARIIGDNVRVTLSLSEETCPVRVDPAHVEQIVLNLAINARDAMPDGGTFCIETRPVPIDSEVLREWGNVAGPCIAMIVSDTGHGMAPDVQSRVFEPFFTTKEVGRGTGLGLSTVYGIVAQNGGWIRVDSQPGLGTTFTVLLPRVEAVMAGGLVHVPPQVTPRGSEAILLVEDERALRDLAASVLQTPRLLGPRSRQRPRSPRPVRPAGGAHPPAADRPRHAGDDRRRTGEAGAAHAARDARPLHVRVHEQPREPRARPGLGFHQQAVHAGCTARAGARTARSGHHGPAAGMIETFFHAWERRLASVSQDRVVRPFEWGLDWIGTDAPAVETGAPEVLSDWVSAGHERYRCVLHPSGDPRLSHSATRTRTATGS